MYNIGVGGVSPCSRRHWLNYEKHLTNELWFVGSVSYELKYVRPEGERFEPLHQMEFPKLNNINTR